MNAPFTHKRTTSGNLQSEGLYTISHRRILSTVPESQKTSSSGTHFKELQDNEMRERKITEFLGLLDAAETYFDEDMMSELVYPPCELDSLTDDLEKIETETQRIIAKTEKLEVNYSKLLDRVEDNIRIQEELDSKTYSLKRYSEQLDNILDETTANLEKIINKANSSSCSKDQLSIPQAFTTQIKYKPISKRIPKK